MEIVTREMERIVTDILGISEMRWSGKGHFNYGNYRVMFSGNDTSKNAGVAIICNKTSTNAIMGYNPISERIMTLQLKGQPTNLSIVQVYAPTSTAQEDDVEKFYEELQATLDSLPKKDTAIIMGDFNAKVGSKGSDNILGKFGLGDRNEAGERLVEFCAEKSLIISNTLFQQPKRRVYTWTSPNGQY